VHVYARFLVPLYISQPAWAVVVGSLGSPDGFGRRASRQRPRFGSHPDFLERVPLPTRRAFANPFGRFLSAVGTYEHCLVFSHNDYKITLFSLSGKIIFFIFAGNITKTLAE
jgi:hypothetical protein